MKKEIMQRAWEIAREGVKKFGGKVKEYLSIALKTAWFEKRKPAILFEFEASVYCKTPKEFWNYCKRRLLKKGVNIEDYFSKFEEWEQPLYETDYSSTHDDWDRPVSETCKQKKYEIHIYQQKAYNYILEYDFFEGKEGFGYCYIKDCEV